MKLKLAGIALKQNRNTKETKETHRPKSRTESILMNSFSIFRTVLYDRYIPIQNLISMLLPHQVPHIKMFTASKELGIPAVQIETDGWQ